jgi:DNA-binding CsgD family transcriptional regulator
MDEAVFVSELIGGIYDAALDRSLWAAVLERTCAYVGGQSAALVADGPGPASGRLVVDWGAKPEFVTSYRETYAPLNPMIVPTLLHAKAGSVLASGDLVPAEELRATRFYKEWLAPQGIVDAVSATFEKSALSYAMLAINRGERHGAVDDKARRRMQFIAPHFQRAVAIGKVVDLHRHEAAMLADTLDALADGVFLVQASGAVMQANAAGRRLLAGEDAVLHASSDLLSPVDSNAKRILQETLPAAAAGDTAVGTKGIAVPLTAGDGVRHVAYVLPLTSGARRQAGATYSAVAAVFIRKAALELPHPVEVLAQTYKLSAAELRVLVGIVQLGGVPEVAPVLGIAESTVKAHLQHVFEKTGASRQADLVKIVAGFMSPIGASAAPPA